QELRLLPDYVRKEMERQRSLIEIKNILSERKVQRPRAELVDLSSALKSCRSKVIAGALTKGGVVLGAALPGYEGLMRSADGRFRLGAEMAQRARVRAGVQGIFHSDELPGYGVTDEDVARIRAALGRGGAVAFVLCADEPIKAKAAVEAAVERAAMATEGVPEETRDPLPDGSSVYSRPLPGASRMYPETDVRPIIITAEKMIAIRSKLPPLPEEVERHLVSKYAIHPQQARQLVREGWEAIFEEAASRYGLAAIAAKTLLNTLPEIAKEGADISKLDDEALRSAFRSLYEGAFAKEAMPEVLKAMCRGITVEQAVKELGLGRMDLSGAEAIIAQVVAERMDFVRQKGIGAVGPLMGPVMERLRGKVDGKVVNEILRREISKVLGIPDS
ncbi:MAG: Glu-tRNA(Gln) amidotransferase subunit GatE, partial [Methanomassiliicoccales archaeon]